MITLIRYQILNILRNGVTNALDMKIVIVLITSPYTKCLFLILVSTIRIIMAVFMNYDIDSLLAMFDEI